MVRGSSILIDIASATPDAKHINKNELNFFIYFFANIAKITPKNITRPMINIPNPVKLATILDSDIYNAIVPAIAPTATMGAKLARRRSNEERNNITAHSAANRRTATVGIPRPMQIAPVGNLLL